MKTNTVTSMTNTIIFRTATYLSRTNSAIYMTNIVKKTEVTRLEHKISNNLTNRILFRINQITF